MSDSDEKLAGLLRHLAQNSARKASAASKAEVTKTKPIETLHSNQVETNRMPSGITNSAIVARQKDQLVKYIGHFCDHGDGTVTDTRTGLMWMREREVSKVGVIEALAIRKEFAGYGDWRLPTLAELKSINWNDYILCFAKPVAGFYWSCTKQKTADSYDSWYAIISSTGSVGAGNPSTGVEYVRLVRLGTFAINTTTCGPGSGTISRVLNSGHKCGESDVDGYVKSSVVTLIARPTVGSIFKRWHGDARGQGATCTVTMDCPKDVSAEFAALETFSLTTISTGKGTGVIEPSLVAAQYFEGTNVTLTAIANAGSKFECWQGDATGQSAACSITMDSIKIVAAKFVALDTFSLTTIATGTGSGDIERSRVATQYVDGTRVILTARPNVGSKFKCWHGDATGPRSTCGVTMDSIKSVSAEFVALENFSLITFSTGTGTGKIERSPAAKEYLEDTKVTLAARANVGSKFRCWHGNAKGTANTCTVTMDSAKNVSAEFVALESFDLAVTATGTGRGRIKRDIDSPSYFADTEVTLIALAEEGSIFNGWHGDVDMLDDAITVTMNSAYSISAEFVQLDIADTEIAVELVSITKQEVKRDQYATVFRLMLRNNSDRQVRIRVPLTSYVSQSGQTTEQSSWAAGLVNGSKGVTLSAGTFCEVGLVHFKGPAKGDRLYVNVDQIQPTVRVFFTFQCTGDWDEFLLINSSIERQGDAPSSKASHPGMASALKRIESLESTLAEVLRRLDAIQRGLPLASRNNPSNQTGPVQTLSEVLAWVAEHERISVAELRAKLLPLDLLPGAVMDELNERALDLAGEIALTQVGDEVVVNSAVFDEVLANWDK